MSQGYKFSTPFSFFKSYKDQTQNSVRETRSTTGGSNGDNMQYGSPVQNATSPAETIRLIVLRYLADVIRILPRERLLRVQNPIDMIKWNEICTRTNPRCTASVCEWKFRNYQSLPKPKQSWAPEEDMIVNLLHEKGFQCPQINLWIDFLGRTAKAYICRRAKGHFARISDVSSSPVSGPSSSTMPNILSGQKRLYIEMFTTPQTSNEPARKTATVSSPSKVLNTEEDSVGETVNRAGERKTCLILDDNDEEDEDDAMINDDDEIRESRDQRPASDTEFLSPLSESPGFRSGSSAASSLVSLSSDSITTDSKDDNDSVLDSEDEFVENEESDDGDMSVPQTPPRGIGVFTGPEHKLDTIVEHMKSFRSEVEKNYESVLQKFRNEYTNTNGLHASPTAFDAQAVSRYVGTMNETQYHTLNQIHSSHSLVFKYVCELRKELEVMEKYRTQIEKVGIDMVSAGLNCIGKQ